MEKLHKIFEETRTFLQTSKASFPNLSPRIIQQLLFAGLSLLLLGLFIKIGYNVFFDAEDARVLQIWDDRILLFIEKFRRPLITQMAVDLTSLGSSTVVALLVALCIGVFVLLKDWLGAVHLIIASLGSGFCVYAFKSILERPRPHVVPQLIEVTGFSFPSGHALGATALYLTIAIISARHFPRLGQRAVLFSFASLIALLIGGTRIYLGVHYPTDVASGMLLGAAWAFLVAAGTLSLTKKTAH